MLARNPIRIIVGGLIALVLVGFGVYRLVNRAGGAVNGIVIDLDRKPSLRAAAPVRVTLGLPLGRGLARPVCARRP